jgi:hypothetical protein
MPTHGCSLSPWSLGGGHTGELRALKTGGRKSSKSARPLPSHHCLNAYFNPALKL